jgi:hypothetical protein
MQQLAVLLFGQECTEQAKEGAAVQQDGNVLGIQRA